MQKLDLPYLMQDSYTGTFKLKWYALYTLALGYILKVLIYLGILHSYAKMLYSSHIFRLSIIRL